MENKTARCVVAGGGPAGVMLGYLLARAGVHVVVLEKHADFFRDFRGDTIHPSTLRVMDELGVIDDFLKIPHRPIRTLQGDVNGDLVTLGDIGWLKGPYDYIAVMPQWDFLDFIADRAAAYDGFELVRNAEVQGLIAEDGRVAGVRVGTPDGPLEVRADLVVAADGRASVLRQEAKLPLLAKSAPMDVLWFRMPRHEDDPDDTFGIVRKGRFMVMINRTDYWQTAYLVPKGGADELMAGPVQVLRDAVEEQAPFLAGRVADALPDWGKVSLLSVRVDRLRRWHRRGLLCIGDSAHAMSPIGGVGVNLAVQDAIAAANLLADPLSTGAGHAELDRLLPKLQRRREWPVRIVQAVQVLAQNRFIKPVLSAPTRDVRLPGPVRTFLKFPPLHAVPALLFARGVLPEHVHTPDVRQAAGRAER